MDTFTILQDALRQKKITPRRAVRIANNRLGGDWAVTEDSYRLQEKHHLFVDMSGRYYESNRHLFFVNSRDIRDNHLYINQEDFDKGIYKVFRCGWNNKYYDESYTIATRIGTGDFFNSFSVYISGLEFGRNQPTSWVCLEYAVNSGILFYWSSSNTYCTYPEPVAPAPVSEITPGYHAIERPRWWRNASGIGMELEILTTNPLELRKQLPPEILAEVDGSIDRNYGLELIGGPYDLDKYTNDKTPWKEIVEFAQKNGCKGHNAGEFYGIHLSLSKSLFSTLHGAKFVVFFNQQAELCQLIAQRSSIYNGSYGARKKVKDVIYNDGSYSRNIEYTDPVTRTYKPMKGITYNRYLTETTKYEPVRADGRRYEVRIFRSNLRWERILKNVEFVDAVKEFTRDASIVDISTPYKGTAAFLYWLGKNPAYPNLKKFLLDNASGFAIVCDKAAQTIHQDKQKEFRRLLNFKLKKEQTLDDQ